MFRLSLANGAFLFSLLIVSSLLITGIHTKSAPSNITFGPHILANHNATYITLLNTGPPPIPPQFSEVLWKHQAVGLAFRVAKKIHRKNSTVYFQDTTFTLKTSLINATYNQLRISLCPTNSSSPSDLPTPDLTKCLSRLTVHVDIYDNPVHYTWQTVQSHTLSPGSTYWITLESNAQKVEQAILWLDTLNGTNANGVAFADQHGVWVGEGKTQKGVASLTVRGRL